MKYEVVAPTPKRRMHQRVWKDPLFLLGSLSVAACLGGCGSMPEQPGELSGPESGAEHLGTQSEALSLSKLVPPRVAKLASNAADLAGVFSQVKTGLEMASALAEAFGLIDSPPSEIELLKQELDRVAGSLDWKLTATARANQWGRVWGAVIASRDGMSIGQTLPRYSPDDNDSRDAVIEAGDLTMFMRLFIESSTDGPWKGIIANRAPEMIGDGQQVFDWRLALPWLLQLTSLRLQVMGAIDPGFNTNGSFNEELTNMRARLQEHLQRMKAGIRCDHVDRIRIDGVSIGNPVVTYQYSDVACADVNTGASITSTFVIPNYQSCVIAPRRGQELDQACVRNLPGQATIVSIQDDHRRQLLRNMPIFQLQSMIDQLYRYSHPGPEFTESLGQISTELTADLCLDVQWGSSAAETPVWLWDCFLNDAQWWMYDRRSGAIVNPAYGLCLEVRPLNDVQLVNYYRGATVQTYYCGSPLPERQKWTYDPESRVLQNAVGTVLDVQWGYFEPGTPVWTWDRDGNLAQQWHTD